jgi:hypothetical protein
MGSPEIWFFFLLGICFLFDTWNCTRFKCRATRDGRGWSKWPRWWSRGETLSHFNLTTYPGTIPFIVKMGHSMLPLELWQIILRYSISVPDFLDPDVVDNIPLLTINYVAISWNNRKPYWAAERTRNCLRRVCKSWDAYLRQYEQRLVCMDDVVRGVVSPEHLRSAVRITFTGSPSILDYHPRSDPVGKPKWKNSGRYQEVCDLYFKTESLHVQILDFDTCPSNMANLLSSIRASTFANLVILQAPYLVELEILAGVINSLPKLRHCCVLSHWKRREKLPSLKSSTLTSLLFPFVFSMPALEYHLYQELHLPSLKHLSLTTIYSYPSIPFQSSLRAFLKVVGRELRSLFLPEGFELFIPEEIWGLCPKLELLHTPVRVTVAPPPGHPIHTLSFPHDLFTDPHRIRSLLPDWPGIRAVRMDRTWQNLRGRSIPQRIDIDARMEDVTGESLADFRSRTANKSQ